MMTRSLAVVVAFLLLTPWAALAQAPLRAGVITTLEGHVTARRGPLPDPVTLKFRDDVHVQDTVITGDKAFARMLLGGKAVVTVRERSRLTITEVPGKTTIDLASGKFALAVAREQMRGNEQIEIRTPNAVGGVRGTVVVTEVARQTAQAGGSGAPFVTSFYVLRGSITAQQLDPVSGQPKGTPLQVGTLQAYRQAGDAAPRLAPVPPEQVSEVTSGLQPSGPRGGGNAASEQVKEQAVSAANGLLAALTGTGAVETTPANALLATAASGGIAEVEKVALLIPEVAAAIEQNAELLAQSLGTGDALLGNVTLQNTPARRFSGSFKSTSTDPLLTVTDAVVAQNGANFIDAIAGASAELAGPLARFVNSALVTDGSLFAITGGSLTSTTTSALIDLDPTVISAVGALVAMNGGVLSLAGPLLIDTGGVIATAAPLVTMTNGALLQSTSGQPLVTFAGTFVATVGALSMTDSTMHLAGPLVHAAGLSGADSNSTLPLFLLDGSTLTSTGSAPLMTFTSTDGDPDSNFLRMVNRSRMTLAGPLFAGSGSSSVFGGGTPTSAAAFISLLDGSTLTGTGSAPLISLLDTTFDGNGPVVSLRRSPSTSEPTTMALAGPLFSATNTSINTTTKAFGATFGTVGNCCAVFGVEQGAVLTSTTPLPLISLAASTVTISDADSGSNLVLVSDSVTGFPANELVAPSTMSLAGPLLAASGSTVTPLFSILSVNRSAFASSSTAPLITLTGSTIKAGGTDIFGTPQPGRLVSVISTNNPFGSAATPASITLAGPLLSATSSTFDGTQVLGIFGGGSFTSTTTAPLLSLSNSLLKLSTTVSGSTTNRGDVVSIGGIGGADAATFATMVLHGPLLNVDGLLSSLSLSSGLVGIFNGGVLIESHPTDPFIAINGGTHSLASEAGFAMFRLFGRPTATAPEVISTPGLNTSISTLTLGTDQPLQRSGSGAYLDVANATVTGRSGLILDHALLNASAPLLSLRPGASFTMAADALNLTSQAKLTSVGPLVKLDGAVLNITGHALRAMGGSFVSVAGDLFSLANASQLTILNGGALFISGGSVVKINGGFVNFGGGAGNQISIVNTAIPTLGCSTQCGPFGAGIKLQNGASFGNVSISSNAIKNAGLGSVNVVGSAIILDGPTSKLIVSGN